MRAALLASPGSAGAVAALLLCLGIAGCGPSDPVARIQAQQQAGDLQGSLEPLRELLEERPDDPQVLFLYGRALSLTGQPSLAEWPLRKAMEDPEWLVPAGIQLAFGALSSRNYASAIQVTTRMLEAEPENVQALLMRANAYAHSKRDYEQALADVDRIFELDPDLVDALEPRILALLGLERIEEAGAAIEELGERIEETELGPDVRAWHCATRAIFADESGESERAAELWADCLERHPSSPKVVPQAVEFYQGRGQFDRVLEILREALEKEPARREYRVALAERLRMTGKKGEAEDLLREATGSESPELAAGAWLDLAGHHQALGEHRAALQALERVLELTRQVSSPHPELLLSYADMLVLAGELDRALEVTNEMETAAHREMIRARVAQERGDPVQALEHFEDAFRHWPDNPWARYHAALAAEAIGDFDRAIEAYRYAIRIAAGATDARTRVARLHVAEGRPAEAQALLRIQSQHDPLDLEGEIFSLRLWAWLGRTQPLRRSLAVFRSQRPDLLGRALASTAEGVRERAGPAAALRMLLEAQGLDLEDPRHADALRALVRLSHEAGPPDAAEPAVAAALRAHPDAAAFHEIHGLWLELHDAPPAEVRAAYERALEIDAADARALAGLARIALAGDPERALSFFDRAAAADPGDVEALRGAAQALRASGRAGAAEERLEALLRAHPYDAAAAAELARLQLERGEASERTLERAKRAVRFGGGADALDLLSRVYERRNEPERATEAAARARALREGAVPEA
jgi:tetratricopeptide (TPR) repeat protein